MSSENWKDYVVNVGGIDFRPVSMGTLTLLYQIKSPIIMGGVIEPLDFCVFAWMHAAPIQEVYNSINADTYEKKAIMWGSEVPPIIYTSYAPTTIKSLMKDLNKLFIEEKSGYIPFPLPSPLRLTWWQRAIRFIIHR
jgi:hypothetical protein